MKRIFSIETILAARLLLARCNLSSKTTIALDDLDSVNKFVDGLEFEGHVVRAYFQQGMPVESSFNFTIVI